MCTLKLRTGLLARSYVQSGIPWIKAFQSTVGSCLEQQLSLRRAAFWALLCIKAEQAPLPCHSSGGGCSLISSSSIAEKDF